MRWILRLVLVLVLLVLILVGGLFLIPADRIGALVGEQFERFTGRSLVISGGIRPSIYPALGVTAEGIEVGTPDWAGEAPLVRAERLNVGVALGPLFSGNIHVKRFELVKPEIVLIRNMDGAVNWELAGASDAADQTRGLTAEGGGLRGLNIDEAQISDGSFIYRDLAAGTEMTTQDLNLTFRLPSASQPIRLEGSGEVNGAEVSVQAMVSDLAQLLDSAQSPVTLGLIWDGGSAGFEGQTGLAPFSLSGAVNFDATDLAPIMALAGQGALALPRGFGRDRLAGFGSITLTADGGLSLHDLQLTFDDNELIGMIELDPTGDKPLIRANLQGGPLDLSGLMEGESEASATGWSRDPIDVSALHAIDADVSLALASLDAGIMTLGTTRLTATLTAGRLVFDLTEVAAYGGSIAGQYVVNGRGGLSTGGDITASNVGLKPLLTEFAGFDRLEGTGTGRVKFLAVGNDMHTLMNSLSGSGALEFGQGAILGLDIGGMILNMDTSYRGEGQRTVYDSITASFTMEGGIVSNNDLEMRATFGEMTGSGNVGVGQQVLDYTVVPGVLTSEGTEDGVRVPLRIQGPWDNLAYSLDLEALAEQELSDEIEALEERAIDALSEQLGLGTSEDEASEGDATQSEEETGEEPPAPTLEEQLQEGAVNALQQLLEGNN